MPPKGWRKPVETELEPGIEAADTVEIEEPTSAPVTSGPIEAAPQDRDIWLLGANGERVLAFWYKTRIFDGTGWKQGHRWARCAGYGPLGFTPVRWERA